MEAHTDVLLLESEGIETKLDDAQTIHIDPLIAHALGGVKLYVAEGDAMKAASVLQCAMEKKRAQRPDEYLLEFETDWTGLITWSFLLGAAIVVVLFGVSAGNGNPPALF